MFDDVTSNQLSLESLDLSSFKLANSSQAQLEMLYCKYQLTKCIAAEFIEAGAVEELDEMGIPSNFGLDLMVQIYLHKRADIATLVGILKHHFEDQPEPLQACADMILKACEHDVVDHATLITSDPDTGGKLQKHMLIVRHSISAETQAKIDQFQYPLPMIQEPLPVHNNKQTGYYTIKGSLLLKDNHHDEDICLDHINRVNQIPLALNADVVAFVQNKWKNLDRPKPGEKMEKYQARKRAFEKYDRTSREVIEALMAHGNHFWLTSRYDKRGRTYAQGYHVNYQGTDWCKACIEFADAEPLNKE